MEKGFAIKNWKLKLLRYPSEDVYSINKKTIAVADGVTRDPFPKLPGRYSLTERIKFFLKYPRPSSARIAAYIFCKTFPKVINDYNIKDENAVRTAFTEANSNIHSWNTKNILEIDYLVNDFAGCVAAGTVENKGILYYGYIADCGIAVFDENGKSKFKTENEGPDKYETARKYSEKMKNFEWNNPESRKMFRKYYRNNPEEKCSFGVLTGEKSALKYVKTGALELGKNECYVVYSDGVEKILFSDEFSKRLRTDDFNGIERLCKKNVQYEGTLVISKNN